MKGLNRQFKHYTLVIAVLVLVAISTAQLSSVVPSDGNVVYAYSTNSQAQSYNNECENDDSSDINCTFNRPVYIGNTSAVTMPPSQKSAPHGPPGSLGNDSSQTIGQPQSHNNECEPDDDSSNINCTFNRPPKTVGIPHDEYNTKMQEVLKNALKD